MLIVLRTVYIKKKISKIKRISFHLRSSFMQLKVVGPVAVLGGLLQIMTFMFLCGITAVVYYCWHPFLISLEVTNLFFDMLKWLVGLWSKLVRGHFCRFLLVNVINSSGMFLDHFDSIIYQSDIDTFLISFYQVVKFLVERNSNNALHGQVTIGTLIFQVSFT